MDIKNISKHAGFSLIELMIAMLIGLIVLNGVIQLVINSKRSYLDNQAISQIQENARFSVDILSREIKMAGYLGCMPVNNGQLDVSSLINKQRMLLTDSQDGFSSLEIFEGKESDKSHLPEQIRGDALPGHDVLVVRHTDPDHEWVINKDLSELSGTIEVPTTKAIAKNAPVAVVSHDCAVANLLQASDATDTSLTVNNASGSFGYDSFKKGSRVTPIVAYAYYIGYSNVLGNNDMPALKREKIYVDGSGELKARSEELAIGVSDMQIEVGTVAAGVVNFADFNGIADKAAAVRVTLTLRSHNPVPPASDGESGYIEKVAAATVRIRNQG